VSPSATNPDLTNEANGFKTFYRVIAPDTVQGREVTRYIVSEFAPTKVFSLDDRSDYGTGLSKNIEAGLTQAGVQVVHDGINPTDDYTSEATKIVGENPDVLFYSGYYAEFALLTKALRDKAFKGVIMSGDGSLDPQYIQQAGADVTEGVYISCACGDANTDPAAAAFVRSYGDVNDGAKPGTYSGEAYDATNAIIEVLKGLGDPSRISRDSLAGAFGSVEYQGITKLIKFEENGEVQESSIFIFNVTGGKIGVVGKTEELVRP
jgi:branched-chain amino acid transport system substrate-binding protein